MTKSVSHLPIAKIILSSLTHSVCTMQHIVETVILMYALQIGKHYVSASDKTNVVYIINFS